MKPEVTGRLEQPDINRVLELCQETVGEDEFAFGFRYGSMRGAKHYAKKDRKLGHRVAGPVLLDGKPVSVVIAKP